MTAEPLSMRVVRTVHQVAPRRLSSRQVIDAFPDEKSTNVYTALGNASQEKGPLDKKRGNAGVLEYGVRPGYDIAAYLARPPRRRAAGAPDADDNLAICVRIVQTLQKCPKRLTADELGATGLFPDRKVLALNLGLLCEEGEPLERERITNGGAFFYGIKSDFDIAAWIAERGCEPEKVATETATPPVVLTPAPSKEGAEPARVATSVPPAFHAPAIAAAPVARVVHGSVSLVPPEPQPFSKPSPQTAAIAPDIPSAKPPVNGAAKPAAFDLSTETAILAGAILAAELRSCLTDIPARIERALSNFERADKVREAAR